MSSGAENVHNAFKTRDIR